MDMLPYLCAPHPRSDIHKGTRQAIVTLCLVPFYRLCIYSPICRNAGDACHAGYPAAPIPLTFISFNPPLFLVLRLICHSEPSLLSHNKSEQFIALFNPNFLCQTSWQTPPFAALPFRAAPAPLQSAEAKFYTPLRNRV